MNEEDEQDGSGIPATFALHARRLRAELNEYADYLAEGDPELRKDLSIIESWIWG